jgi:hypothetical protein
MVRRQVHTSTRRHTKEVLPCLRILQSRTYLVMIILLCMRQHVCGVRNDMVWNNQHHGVEQHHGVNQLESTDCFLVLSSPRVLFQSFISEEDLSQHEVVLTSLVIAIRQF